MNQHSSAPRQEQITVNVPEDIAPDLVACILVGAEGIEDEARRASILKVAAAIRPSSGWTAADYEHSARIHAAAEAITRRLTEHAVSLAITRHELEWDQDADITEVDIAQDAVRVALGEDSGCLDPDSLDETNCELLFVEAELRKLFPKPTSITEFADRFEQLATEEDSPLLHELERRGWEIEQSLSGVLGSSIADKTKGGA